MAISICGQKESMIETEKIDRRINRLCVQLKRLRIYLEPWLKVKLTYEEYTGIVKRNTQLKSRAFTAKIPEYRSKGIEDATITEIIEQIERKELEDIFGGASVTVNLDSSLKVKESPGN